MSALFVPIVPFRDLGDRSNLFSAVCGGFAAGVFWTFLRRQKVGVAAATAATCCLAFGSTFWSQCLCAEVHALNCLLFALALLTAFAAAARPHPVSVALCGVVCGLLVGHRIQKLIYLPGVLLPLAVALRSSPSRGRLVAAFGAAALSTAVVYANLPIAASRDPSLDMGAPNTWARFRYVVSARPYLRHLGAAPLTVDLRRLLGFVASLPWEIGVATLAIPVGIGAWWRNPGGRESLLCFAWIFTACCVFSAAYNVLDVDSYFLPAIMALVVVGAAGLERLPRWRFSGPALVGLAVIQILVNLDHTSLRGNWFGRTYGDDLLRSAPRSAVLISFGDTATHLLWYRQHVDHQRPDVTIVSADEISNWYLEKLRHRDQVDWPPEDDTLPWISELIRRNLDSHPICTTQPIPLAPEGWAMRPAGLVFCLDRQTAPPEVASSLAFWSSPPPLAPSRVLKADIRVQMAAFSYAVARFSFIRALVQAGDFEAARSQAMELLLSDPDPSQGFSRLLYRSTFMNYRRVQAQWACRAAWGASTRCRPRWSVRTRAAVTCASVLTWRC